MADDDEDFDSKPTPGNRRASLTLSDSERARHRRSWVRGVPVVRPDPSNEVTAPLELLLNGELTTDDYAQVEALRRSADDVYVLLMNLSKAIGRHRDRDRSGSKEVERQVLAAIEEQARQTAVHGERLVTLEADNKETKRRLSFWQKIAGGALALAITSSGALVTKIWDRAGDEREVKVTQRYMQADIDRLSKQLERSRKDPP